MRHPAGPQARPARLIAAADLLGIEQKWRAKLAKDEASIVDLVEAEDLEIATDLMVPFAHWITPTFAPRRFDTWFFLAEAPEDQVALHDGSESVDSVWIGAQQAIDEATAGQRTLVHATTKNLELLAEGGTVTGAISQASERKIVTVQPWVESRDGKRYPAHPAGRRLPQPGEGDAADAGGEGKATTLRSRTERFAAPSQARRRRQDVRSSAARKPVPPFCQP